VRRGVLRGRAVRYRAGKWEQRGEAGLRRIGSCLLQHGRLPCKPCQVHLRCGFQRALPHQHGCAKDGCHAAHVLRVADLAQAGRGQEGE